MARDYELNLVVVGESGVGKTAFVKFLESWSFTEHFPPTTEPEKHAIVFDTNFGPIRYCCWDTPGTLPYRGDCDGICADAHVAIIMFDVQSSVSFRSVLSWYHHLKRVCRDDIQIIVCGNKAEGVGTWRTETICFARDVTLPYFEFSVRSEARGPIEYPFLWVLRKLVGYGQVRGGVVATESLHSWIVVAFYNSDENLAFVEVHGDDFGGMLGRDWTPEQIAQFEAENAAAAAAVPLPDEDEDL